MACLSVNTFYSSPFYCDRLKVDDVVCFYTVAVSPEITVTHLGSGARKKHCHLVANENNYIQKNKATDSAGKQHCPDHWMKSVCT